VEHLPSRSEKPTVLDVMMFSEASIKGFMRGVTAWPCGRAVRPSGLGANLIDA
jgi:hypothetical protein